MNIEKTPKTPRRRWGRRREDWLVPLLLLGLTTVIGLWAWDNYSKVRQLEEINRTLAMQSHLLERLLKHGDQARGEVSVPFATPAPTMQSTPMASARKERPGTD